MILCSAQSLQWPDLYHEWCGIKSFYRAWKPPEQLDFFIPLSPKTRIPQAAWKKLHSLSAVWVTESVGLEKSFKIRVQSHKPRPQCHISMSLIPPKTVFLMSDPGLCFWGQLWRVPGVEAVLGCQERAGWAELCAWEGAGKEWPGQNLRGWLRLKGKA